MSQHPANTDILSEIRSPQLQYLIPKEITQEYLKGSKYVNSSFYHFMTVLVMFLWKYYYLFLLSWIQEVYGTVIILILFLLLHGC